MRTRQPHLAASASLSAACPPTHRQPARQGAGGTARDRASAHERGQRAPVPREKGRAAGPRRADRPRSRNCAEALGVSLTRIASLPPPRPHAPWPTSAALQTPSPGPALLAGCRSRAHSRHTQTGGSCARAPHAGWSWAPGPEAPSASGGGKREGSLKANAQDRSGCPAPLSRAGFKKHLCACPVPEVPVKDG